MRRGDFKDATEDSMNALTEEMLDFLFLGSDLEDAHKTNGIMNRGTNYQCEWQIVPKAVSEQEIAYDGIAQDGSNRRQSIFMLHIWI